MTEQEIDAGQIAVAAAATMADVVPCRHEAAHHACCSCHKRAEHVLLHVMFAQHDLQDTRWHMPQEKGTNRSQLLPQTCACSGWAA